MLRLSTVLVPCALLLATAFAVPSSGARLRAHAAADGSGWNTNATAFRGRNGERFTWDCPSYGTAASIYGTDLYTDDSSVCTAAVHAGVISLAGGGSVTIEIRPDAGSYAATTRNRITSNAYGPWVGAYAIVAATPVNPGVAAGANAWSASANAYRAWIGAQYEYNCPANGSVYRIWGTNTYTDDSSVCTAAVHAGLITVKKGGKVKVEMRDGLAAYRASKRNGITSAKYGAWPGSFIVVDAPDGPDDAEGVATGDVTVNGKPFSAGAVKYGSTIDVTRGTLKLTAAGVGNILTFGDGADSAQYKLNKIVDKVGKKKRTSAELALGGGDFSGCVAGAAAHSAGGPAGKVVRSLWASGKGRFRTKGKYASATVRGTKWQTTDQCDGTLTTVSEGSVLVRDIQLKKNVVVSAGATYLAKSP